LLLASNQNSDIGLQAARQDDGSDDDDVDPDNMTYEVCGELLKAPFGRIFF
jgi:hypothetical protein